MEGPDFRILHWVDARLEPYFPLFSAPTDRPAGRLTDDPDRRGARLPAQWSCPEIARICFLNLCFQAPGWLKSSELHNASPPDSEGCCCRVPVGARCPPKLYGARCARGGSVSVLSESRGVLKHGRSGMRPCRHISAPYARAPLTAPAPQTSS